MKNRHEILLLLVSKKQIVDGITVTHHSSQVYPAQVAKYHDWTAYRPRVGTMHATLAVMLTNDID